MKKNFEGIVHETAPGGVAIGKWLDGDSLASLAQDCAAAFSVVTHPAYACVERRIKLDLFTFARLKLPVPVTVIAPPISVDSAGYVGDLDELIADYKGRKGVFLALNLPERPALREKAAVGETLPSCVFRNAFSSFDEYLAALRGNYRRRLKQAIRKGSQLRVEKINCAEFSEKLHGLYLQTLRHSKYPLETLGLEFFRGFGLETHVFYGQSEPLAFVALKNFGNELAFAFGGMDYAKRDEFDLYYNMLLLIIRQAIQRRSDRVNFGQTAELSKLRVGCALEKRYMAAFSGNPAINSLLRALGKSLSYKAPEEKYRCFSEQGRREGPAPLR